MNTIKWYSSKSEKPPFRLEQSAADLDSENPLTPVIHAIYWGVHGSPVLMSHVDPEHDILRAMTEEEILAYIEIHGKP